jgi:hypothetical protein
MQGMLFAISMDCWMQRIKLKKLKYNAVESFGIVHY